jgi:hypothetical protein
MLDMLLKAALMSLAVATAPPVPAAQQESFWKDERGTPVPDTRFRKSVGGFGAWLVVTSDQDWEEKWNTPAETTPRFTEAKTVAKGGRIFVLLLFANPALSKTGRVDVGCDLEVEKPDRTLSIQQLDIDCFQGPVSGPEHNLYLSAPVIGFVGEEGDPAGEWIVRVKMKDRVRGVNVPLETSFTLH